MHVANLKADSFVLIRLCVISKAGNGVFSLASLYFLPNFVGHHNLQLHFNHIDIEGGSISRGRGEKWKFAGHQEYHNKMQINALLKFAAIMWVEMPLYDNNNLWWLIG